MKSSGLSPAALVVLLGTTQIVGYGTVYYAFAILADGIAASFGWPVSRIYALFSIALLVGGFAAPLAGRLADRHGAPAVMTAGSGLAALALAATAFAPGPVSFGLGLVVVQAVSTGILYDAAFTALVQTCGADARSRITHLTLIAGFASTLFWPLTAWLDRSLDWRIVLLVFAAMNLVVCMPLHGLMAADRRRRGSVEMGGAGGVASAPLPVDPPLPPAVARRVFALATVGFALSGYLLSALLAQMVPALAALGLGSQAALLVSTLFGPAQVLVRFVNMVFGVRRHPLAVTIFGLGMLPLSVVILAATAPGVAGAAVFAILFGFGSGLKSIVQGTLPLALFGSASYGARLGTMAFARQFLAAAAPFLFAWHLEAHGATPALATLAAVGFAGLGAFVAIARIRRKSARPRAD
jgi:MFS family permease